MTINGSPDISVLSVKATFDISGPLPIVSIVNQSEGANLGNITWWFVLTSPTQTPIHEGSFATPDINGTWTNFAITDSWPRPFGQIEWSGAPYNLSVYIQDSLGNQFIDNSYNASICRPAGNTPTSKNYFGVSNTDVRVQCDQARIFFQDQTNSSYKGQFGIQISSILTLVYPIDETGTIPPKFVINNFSTAAVPISYSSDNYQFQTQSVYDYELDLNVHLRIRYQSCDVKKKLPFITFSVLCNIDLMPLICEYNKLVDSIEQGTCVNAEDATRKLTLINPKFSLVIMGIMQPLTGIDVPDLIKQIEEIGGFSCDCCNAPTGIIPQSGSVIDGYTFSIVPVCGDINGTIQVVGTNIQLLLQDKSYVFSLSGSITTTAFTITPSTNGCTKTYAFNVDMVQLSTDILNTIKTNAGLVNLFNSIVSGGGSGINLSVDGKCIFQSSSTFNYTFTLANIPSNTTNALLVSITNGASAVGLTFAFNLTNLPALQAYLNGLGIGVFVVTNPSGQNVQIVSSNNPNNLSSLKYSISATTFTATITSDAAGYVPVSANQVVQYIINYLCGLTDAQVKTSQIYPISYIGGNGEPQTVNVPAGTSLASFLSTLVNLQDQTVSNIGSSLEVSCESIRGSFVPTADPIISGDYILMTKSGSCAQGNLIDIFTYMLTQGVNNATAKAAFCAFVESCGAGLACSPYDFFDVIVTTYDSVCSPIVGIEYSLS